MIMHIIYMRGGGGRERDGEPGMHTVTAIGPIFPKCKMFLKCCNIFKSTLIRLHVSTSSVKSVVCWTLLCFCAVGSGIFVITIHM